MTYKYLPFALLCDEKFSITTLSQPVIIKSVGTALSQHLVGILFYFVVQGYQESIVFLIKLVPHYTEKCHDLSSVYLTNGFQFPKTSLIKSGNRISGMEDISDQFS